MSLSLLILDVDDRVRCCTVPGRPPGHPVEQVLISEGGARVAALVRDGVWS